MVELLHGLLRAEGVEAWYDAHIGPGEDWRIATARALQASRIFVLLFSAEAAQSGDIAKELAAAVLEKKLIIPVRLENIAPSGAFLYELASRNWVNPASSNTEGRQLAELAKGLAHLVKTGARDESVLPFGRSGAGQSPVAKGRRKPVLIARAPPTAIAATCAAAWLRWPAPPHMDRGRAAGLSSPPWRWRERRPFRPTARRSPIRPAPTCMSRQIYVRNLAGGDGIKVTSDGYDDGSPSWSSDGARLAYVAQKPGEPCHIMVWPPFLPERRDRLHAAQGSNPLCFPGSQARPFFIISTAWALSKTLFSVSTSIAERWLQLPKNSPDLIVDMQHLQCSPDGKSLLYVGSEALRPMPW